MDVDFLHAYFAEDLIPMDAVDPKENSMKCDANFLSALNYQVD